MLAMIDRLHAEWMIDMAQAMRVANTGQETFDRVMSLWQAIANGAEVGKEIDAKGRPITDSLEDFNRFWMGDRDTLRKYGALK
jgi:hypothetical protein